MTKQYLDPDNLYIGNAGSHGVKAGNTIYVAGCVGVDSQGTTLGDGSIETQTDGAYESISAVLAEAGASLDDLVMTRVYLTDANDFEAYKQARKKHLRAKGPGQTVLIVKALGRADLKVEIEAIAVVD